MSGSAARPATTTTTTTVAPAPGSSAAGSATAGSQMQRPAAGAVQTPLATPAVPRVN